MRPEELRDLLIRLDERTDRMEKAENDRAILTEKRLDAHAKDIKALRDWKNWATGIGTAVCALFGWHVHGH